MEPVGVGLRAVATIIDTALLFVIGYWCTGLMSLLQGRFTGITVSSDAHSKPFPVGV